MLYFSESGTRSGIVKVCVIFSQEWNALWYCEIWCYIFLRVELALVLWNFVLYFSACGTLSDIVEFCAIFFYVWNTLWYYGVLCYIFPYIEIFGGDNSNSLCTCVLFFLVVFLSCIFVLYFCVVLFLVVFLVLY